MYPTCFDRFNFPPVLLWIYPLSLQSDFRLVTMLVSLIEISDYTILLILYNAERVLHRLYYNLK